MSSESSSSSSEPYDHENLKERKPIVYEEKVPGEKYAPILLTISIILSMMLLFLKFIEVKSLK